MSDRIRHHFTGARHGVEITLKDRFCRPGAAFGPVHVEANMGVERAWHEYSDRIAMNYYRCKVCGMAGRGE